MLISAFHLQIEHFVSPSKIYSNEWYQSFSYSSNGFEERYSSTSICRIIEHVDSKSSFHNSSCSMSFTHIASYDTN